MKTLVHSLVIAWLALSALPPGLKASEPNDAKKRLNVLLLTADDMNHDSPGFMGGKVPDISPNLDRFAASGIVFTYCHNACAMCGPSRSAMMTGMYPQSNGVLGHNNKVPAWWEKTNADRKITSINNWLSQHGWFTARICKSGYRLDKVDEYIDVRNSGNGRDPNLYYDHTKRLIAKAGEQGKPFFLNINSQDPHEYWAGHPHETAQWNNAKMGEGRLAKQKFKVYPSGKPYPEPSRIYTAAEITMPSGYPDDPELREDIKHYFSSVRRLDDTVGKVLQALEESGEVDNTLVMFWSDHGIGWPFAKWSDYPNSTRTPLAVRWPGQIVAGQVDRQHVISTVDVMPTVLEAVGLPLPNPMDGLSIVGLMNGRQREWTRNEVFNCWNFMSPPKDMSLLDEITFDQRLPERTEQYRPMRGLHSLHYTYVWSGWSDGKLTAQRETGALAKPMQVLQRIARDPSDKNYAEHKGRAAFYLQRVPEELYDTVNDPGCLHNLIDDPAHRAMRDEFRSKMADLLTRTRDHELLRYQTFLKQNSPD